MDINKLKYYANLIPELGNGGKKIASNLINAAKNIKDGLNIIDIAPFLGSTTAYLELGLIENEKKKTKIYAIDRWLIDAEYYKKTRNKINFPQDCDIQPMYIENMKPFTDIYPNINMFKLDLLQFNYSDVSKKSIGLVIDDICSPKQLTDHMFKTLIPYCIPGETLFYFMDFYWFRDRPLELHRQYQCDMMKINHKSFKFIEAIPNSKTAVYLYLGDNIKYLENKKYDFDLKGWQ